LTAISPAYSDQGSTAFTLSVTGTGFLSTSTVYWGGTALTTTYISPTQLSATISASNLGTSGPIAITVLNPAPGGGTSNAMSFEVDSAGGSTYAPSMPTLTATVTAGSTATYGVTLPANASNVSVTCFNLPSGATCSYSSSASTVTIATSTSTPGGSYQVTVAFTETVTTTTSGWILIPFLLLPLVAARKRLALNRIWFQAFVALSLIVGSSYIAGCGGKSNSPTKTTQTQQVTASRAITLVVR
jgi:hypothetical protein